MNFLNNLHEPSLLHPLKRRKYRRRLKKIFWAVAVCVFVFLCFSVFLAIKYYPPINNLYQQIKVAKKEVQLAENYLLNQQLKQAAGSLDKAHQQLADAQQNLADITLPKYLEKLASDQKAIAGQLLIIGSSASKSLAEFTLFADDALSIFKKNEEIKLKDISSEQKRDFLKKLFEAPPLLQGIKAKLDLSLAALEQLPIEQLALPVRQFIAPLAPKLAEATTRAEQLISLAQLLPPLAGYPEEKNYLFLLQNNSELRPTGGFIGTYGILKVKDGEIVNFQTDNVYNLDGPAEKYLDIKPPASLEKYLLAKKWFLRDANWSPDFPTSAKKVEWFYHQEGGLVSKIDGVIAITPTVISSLLKITGDLEVDGLKFNADNFTDVLQYQVEKGYYQKGLAAAERKNIIGDLSKVIMQKLFNLPFNRWLELAEAVKNNLDEKQILIYDKNKEFWEFIKENDWAGIIKNTPDDYLLVVDANLASLKTDKVVRREINYKVRENEEGELIAKVDIAYYNEGEFSWQTTRLRTYTRIYVPAGSQLISSSGAMENDRNNKPGEITIDDELGKTVFGGFISIEPEKSGTLSFEYKLPASLAKKAEMGYYNLLVQKQPGTSGHQLKVDLDFNQPIKEFNPTGFYSQRRGNSQVEFKTDLRIDREFEVKFKN